VILLLIRNFIAPKIRKIPPAKIIHLSILAKEAGIFTNCNPKLRKYNPNNKYKTKNNP
jgi:hypothetical protein